MQRRRCEQCGSVWYSAAAEADWICDTCKSLIKMGSCEGSDVPSHALAGESNEHEGEKAKVTLEMTG